MVWTPRPEERGLISKIVSSGKFLENLKNFKGYTN
jgi:hypothetical protein